MSMLEVRAQNDLIERGRSGWVLDEDIIGEFY